jgi:hypothetical protein
MNLRTLRRAIGATCLCLLAACGPGNPGATSPPAKASAGTDAADKAGGGNLIRMTVDGVEWAADREIFCAIDPPGLGRMVMVAGSHGPKDANEQAFNLNLSGVDGPGKLHLVSGGPVTHAIQLANLDPQRVLNGGAMGFDVTVEVLALSRDPLMVEARFAGTLGSTAGTPLRIEDGHVRCTQ